MFTINNEVTRPTPIGVFNVKFEHISQLVLVFLLLTLSKQMPTGNLALFQIKATLEVRHLFEGRRSLEGCTYFAVEIQRCGTY